MKICHVSPGVIKIPPNGWGAIEKIIWSYKLGLENLGHSFTISYPDQIKENEFDIVHCHMANQAKILNKRNIPYIFSFHDHHAFYYGKQSNCYKENQEAINNSIITIVPGRFLTNFFERPYKTFFLFHAVDTTYFKPGLENQTNHKLLCIGNNGYLNDAKADRKGFRLAIETARTLDLEITVVGPSRNNKEFFEANTDLLDYQKLKLIYDSTEEELKQIYQSHTIFLNPSELEAGQPNLTILEALASGLPTASTFIDDLAIEGVKRISQNQNEACQAILYIIDNYKELKEKAISSSKFFDYSLTVKKLIKTYRSILNQDKQFNDNETRNKLIKEYNDIKINRNNRLINIPHPNINIHFLDGAFCEILTNKKSKFFVSFKDLNSKTVVHENYINNNCWIKTSFKYFFNYEISIFDHTKTYLIFNKRLNFSNQRIYLHLDSKSLGDTIAWFPYVEEFRLKHKCQIVCSTFWNNLFSNEYKEIEFVNPGSVVNNIHAMYEVGVFNDKFKEPHDYRKIPLQQIASNILGLEHKEIKPRIYIRKNERESLTRTKLVGISTDSTCQAKFWNYPGGWQNLVDFLTSKGFQVVLLQLQQSNLKNVIKPNCNDIQDTISWLTKCRFYVGISSGTSWLAWALNVPVIMISGFTKPFNEFECIRIKPEDNICNGCWHDFIWDDKAKGDWNWCPNHKGTDRQFECSKTIRPEQIIKILKDNHLT